MRPGTPATPGLLLLGLLCLPGLAPPVAGQAAGAEEIDRIQVLLGKGRYVAAERALRALPTASGRSDFLLGFALIRLYRHAEAEEALLRAVQREPRNHVWLHALAKARLEQAHNLAAIEVLNRAIAISPEPDYRFAKAMCEIFRPGLRGRLKWAAPSGKGDDTCPSRKPYTTSETRVLGRGSDHSTGTA